MKDNIVNGYYVQVVLGSYPRLRHKSPLDICSIPVTMLAEGKTYKEHGASMKRFKYQMKDRKELWVCEDCKKAHAEHILLKSWRLIDRKNDDSACEYCSSSIYVPEQPAELCAHP